MKYFKFAMKAVAALAAVAAALYVVVTYGDQIRAWLKKHLCCKCCAPDAVEAPDDAFEQEAPSAEEPAAEEAPVAEEPVSEEPAVEAAPAEEPVAEPAAEEGEVIADENDFVEGE